MNNFCHLKEFKKKLHFLFPVEPLLIHFLVPLKYSYISSWKNVKIELLFKSFFFSLLKLFFLQEVSLSLSRLSEVTSEGKHRRNLECFSVNPSDLSHENPL